MGWWCNRKMIIIKRKGINENEDYMFFFTAAIYIK